MNLARRTSLGGFHTVQARGNLFSRLNQEALRVTCVSAAYNLLSQHLKSPYSASLCNIASYVDIYAKADTYVGFLPHHALERLLEKRPIVLLTLAKRLITLLSPLGALSVRSHDV